MDSIIVKDLTYQYPTAKDVTLKNISLTVKKGALCALVGTNGSGKTTLCNAIRGFVPAFYGSSITGKVIVNGKDIATMELGDLALDIGYVFQNPFTQVSGVTDTVYEELAFGLENMGIEKDEIHRRVEEIMRLTKIEEFRDRNPYQLSGGQLQRVALASILVMGQDILVIDEPTSQLDPQSTDEIFEIIQLMKGMGKTIILVEHKMEQIAEYADQVVVLDKGEVVMEGPPEAVFSDPKCRQYHVRLPKCTSIALELKDKGVNLEKIPVTIEDAISEIKKVMQGERR